MAEEQRKVQKLERESFPETNFWQKIVYSDWGSREDGMQVQTLYSQYSH